MPKDWASLAKLVSSAPAEQVGVKEAPQDEGAVIDVPPAMIEIPVPPPDALLYVLNEKGQTAGPKDAPYLWCWEGGPRWYYASVHPIPLGRRYAD
jgi:hypothetical protein